VKVGESHVRNRGNDNGREATLIGVESIANH